MITPIKIQPKPQGLNIAANSSVSALNKPGTSMNVAKNSSPKKIAANIPLLNVGYDNTATLPKAEQLEFDRKLGIIISIGQHEIDAFNNDGFVYDHVLNTVGKSGNNIYDGIYKPEIFKPEIVADIYITKGLQITGHHFKRKYRARTHMGMLVAYNYAIQKGYKQAGQPLDMQDLVRYDIQVARYGQSAAYVRGLVGFVGIVVAIVFTAGAFSGAGAGTAGAGSASAGAGTGGAGTAGAGVATSTPAASAAVTSSPAALSGTATLPSTGALTIGGVQGTIAEGAAAVAGAKQLGGELGLGDKKPSPQVAPQSIIQTASQKNNAPLLYAGGISAILAIAYLISRG